MSAAATPSKAVSRAARAKKARDDAEREKRALAKAREAIERGDNFGIEVTKKIQHVQAELRTLLKGAPKVVRNSLASEYGTTMRAKDYEESAWFSGYTGDIGEMLTIKDQGYDLDAVDDKYEETPFYIACCLGNLELVEYMASTPGLVDLNVRNHTGATPFFAAANMGHASIVRFLATKRRGEDFAVDIELPDNNGIVPWALARANGHKEVVKWIDFARKVRWETRGSGVLSPERVATPPTGGGRPGSSRRSSRASTPAQGTPRSRGSR